MGFLMFVLGIFIVWVIIALLEKLFNTRIITRTGSTVADPETFSGLVDITKFAYETSLEKIKKLNQKAFKNLTSQSSSKIEKLKQLQELRNSKTINDNEFEVLKKEIFK